MARALRIEYPGAVYHIMARGNQGRSIFADDKDRQRFLDTLAQACEKTGWHVDAFVLMGNHYHLPAETPEGNLVAGMKWLQSTYTQRYNSRHEIFGHLFRGRYKAVVIDGNSPGYFVTVSTYIHFGIDAKRPGMHPNWSAREDRAYVVAASTHDGVPQVGDRGAGNGALHASVAGGQPDEPPTITQAAQAQNPVAGRRG